MYCDICESIDFYSLIRALTSGVLVERPHHASWSALSSAALSGCPICSLLREAVASAYEQTFEWTREQVETHHQKRDVENETEFILSTVNTGSVLHVDRRLRELKTLTKWELDRATKYPDGLTSRPSIRVCAPLGDNALGISDQCISKEVDFSLCQQWIDECSSSHSGCAPIVDQDLPTRVIDVGPTDHSCEPRLSITRGHRGRYVTLSHCWGNSKPPITTVANFQRYLECISFKTLPRTFQDAIIVTRRLGYRYLWIDSLCIIQGDQADWELEGAQMHGIFAKSAFTIAGPGAVNADDGFLHRRPEPAVPPCRITVRDEGRSKVGDIILTLSDQYLCSSAGLPRPEASSKLRSRAWVLQERFLSPRTVYFGTTQLYMECRSADRFEMKRNPPHHAMHTDGALLGFPPFGDDYAENRETFYRIVRIYSGKMATNEADRLPALSGLASRVCPGRPEEYLAGLWRQDLFFGLHWYTCTAERDLLGKRSLNAAKIPAPSWSWASCDRSISFQYARDRTSSQQAIEIIDARVHVPGLNPYGEVVTGSLTIRGRMKIAKIQKRPAERPADFWIKHLGTTISDFYITEQSGDREVAGLLPDFPEGDRVRTAGGDGFVEIYCLLTGHHTANPNPKFAQTMVVYQNRYWTALALEPVEAARLIFRRVGLVVSNDARPPLALAGYEESDGQFEPPDSAEDLSSWFEDADECEVVII